MRTSRTSRLVMVNVGGFDRVLRFLLGVLLLTEVLVPQFGGYFDGWGLWKYAVAGVDAVLLATAAFGFCPAYRLFGADTCHRH